MFFENEKDVDQSLYLPEDDGTVNWGDIMDENNEEIVSIKNIKKQPQQDAVDLGDELQIIDNDDEIDDNELAQLLSDTSASNEPKSSSVIEESEINSEDFDIDSQLQDVAQEVSREQQSEDDIVPRKLEAESHNGGSSNSTIILLVAVLVVILFAGGGYCGWQYFEENWGGMAQESLPPAPSVQNDMNNITQEELEQRQNENDQVAENNEAAPVQSVDEQSIDDGVIDAQKEEEKKEEEKKEEKKKVINIVPTGRVNPFMPIQKYIAVDVPDTIIDYDKAGIPKPPEEYGTIDEPLQGLMNISVSGIMYDPQKPSAIINLDNNDYFVQVGDRLDDYKILSISRNSVLISLNKNTYRANIGEQFKISTEFQGSAKYLTGENQGARQYYTISDDKSSSNKTKEQLRYTSESDVIIKTRN